MHDRNVRPQKQLASGLAPFDVQRDSGDDWWKMDVNEPIQQETGGRDG